MTDDAPADIAAEIVEPGAQGFTCTFHELCIACNVTPDWVAGLVEHGAIEPVGRTPQDWQFTTLTLIRVAKAKRLERDLGLNLPGLAVTLDLLDQLDEMRARLRALQERRGP